jgi:hypothetical protein
MIYDKAEELLLSFETKPRLNSRTNPMRGFFCDHHRRGTGISACDPGHHARVNNPEPGDTADAKMTVEHDHGIGETSHPDCPNWMENCGSDITRKLGQICIRLILATRFVLFRQIFGERWLLRNASRQAERIDSHFLVFSRAEIVWRYCRCVFKVRTFDENCTSASRIDITDTCSESRERVEWLTKRFQTEWLNWQKHLVVMGPCSMVQNGAGRIPDRS